jgi:LuxR family maltose regulon positive regulatory protein
LSERELQVLGLLSSELSGPDIARALFISPNTLHTHSKHIFSKLGVTSRRAAVTRARDLIPAASPSPDAYHPPSHIIG